MSTYGRIIIIFFNCTDLASLCSSVSCTLLCLSRSFLLLNFSLLSITVHVLVSLLHLEFLNDFSINCGVFPISSGLFCVCNIRTISYYQCGTFRLLQDFSVHVTYEPFLLCTSMGLSGYFRSFLCTKCTNHFFYYLYTSVDFFVYKTYEQFLLTSVVSCRKFLGTRRTNHFYRSYWGSLRLAPP